MLWDYKYLFAVGRDILTLSPFIPGRPDGPGSPGKPKSPLGPWKDKQCKMTCSQSLGFTVQFWLMYFPASLQDFQTAKSSKNVVNKEQRLQNPLVPLQKHSHAFFKRECGLRRCEIRTKWQMLINYQCSKYVLTKIQRLTKPFNGCLFLILHICQSSVLSL